MEKVKQDWSNDGSENIIGKLKQIITFIDFSPDFYAKKYPSTSNPEPVAIDEPNFV